jgi:hypothetical protein
LSLRSEVEDTYFRYAWCYDEGDMDGLVDTFADDGVLLSSVGDPGPHRGHAAIRRFMQTGRDYRRTLGQQPRHMLSGTTVVSQSATEVSSRCYMTLVVTLSDGRAVADHAGRYLDRLTLVDGIWKFAERSICVDRDLNFSGRLLPAP